MDFAMKILQIAPPVFKIPPDGYGGTERIIYYLTEELVKQGHEVSILASVDSKTSAKLIPYSDSLRGKNDSRSLFRAYNNLFEIIADVSRNYDILHFHLSNLNQFLFTARIKAPFLTTIHDPLSGEKVKWIMEKMPKAFLSAISNSQKESYKGLNWIGVQHHGLPKDLFDFSENTDGYLLYLGKLAEEKGFDDILRLAYMSKKKFKVAAKKDDKPFSKQSIKIMKQLTGIEYFEEVGGDLKKSLLAKADGLILPIRWNEPFGLVAIEALASGTPVIARKKGALPEIINEAQNGFFFTTLHEALERIDRLPEIKRENCRKSFEENFTVEKMTDGYIRFYLKILEQS